MEVQKVIVYTDKGTTCTYLEEILIERVDACSYTSILGKKILQIINHKQSKENEQIIRQSGTQQKI